MKFRRFDAKSELMDTLAGEITARARAAIDTRGRAILALSGGTSPLPLYAGLAVTDMDWHKVAIALVDERWVPVDSGASNEKSLRESLAPALRQGASLIGMKTPNATAAAGQPICEDRYAKLALPFDTVVLGMGIDGHVASLFPGAQGLADALAMDGCAHCAAITARESAATGVHTERMTLTLPTLLQSRQIDLMIFGNTKRQVLDRALAGIDLLEMPVRAVLHQDSAPVTVWWAT